MKKLEDLASSSGLEGSPSSPSLFSDLAQNIHVLINGSNTLCIDEYNSDALIYHANFIVFAPQLIPAASHCQANAWDNWTTLKESVSVIYQKCMKGILCFVYVIGDTIE